MVLKFILLMSVTIGNSLQGLNTFSGIREFVHEFDGFIIDQWGVLHDGKVPYNGAIECLQNIRNLNKKIVLLSNSSKRKSSVFKGLEKVGFERQLFDDCITSGEVAWEMIVNNAIPNIDLLECSRGTGKNVFVIGNGDDDYEYISSTGCTITSPELATFMLARGTFSILDGIEEQKYSSEELMKNINPWLERSLKRDLLLFISNPDIMRPGSNAPMPGQIGARYKAMGGRVEYVGKPYNQVYEKCLTAIIRQLDTCAGEGSEGCITKDKICGIGDSLLHDIVGAQNFGIKSVWTANGVHSNELGTSEGSPLLASEDIMRFVMNKYSEISDRDTTGSLLLHNPDYILPCLRW